MKNKNIKKKKMKLDVQECIQWQNKNKIKRKTFCVIISIQLIAIVYPFPGCFV